ncbi:alpha-galactosidase [Sphingomonas sp. H39-1-10]|uniref:glycoside hydrolase family 36 protein n=1 Tax=Sphingomonas pollutisoli TaxID=3030829 RepID=UPI0023BA39BE|nr:glycoside hydrolase family 36 protein [Sphingomonas pollutisoli]MDF0488936.1 alpha-galactosidase [Sphingomonas pollutisoli]
MSQSHLSRRGALSRLSGAAALIATSPAAFARVALKEAPILPLSDGVLTIAFDTGMHSRVSMRGKPLTAMEPGEAIRLGDQRVVDRFLLVEHTQDQIAGGRVHHLRGTAEGIEKRITVTFLAAYPGLALLDIRYRNTGAAPLAVAGWQAATHDLLSHPDGAWSFSGASYPDRRDWVQPIRPGTGQRNFMGMNATDYGGGTPVAVVWRRDAGIAVGHVDTVPRLVSLPVAGQPGGTRIAIVGDQGAVVPPGGTLALPPVFLMVHEGDHFRPLDAYRRLMAERGFAAPAIPEPSYAPVWCAWGYGRDFKIPEVLTAMGKAKEIGLEWAVLDDGWQTSEGDWKLNPAKFPRGDADMKAFAAQIKAGGMRPRLWLAPLAADPGTDLLRDHPDMLLLDANGAAQNVSFWDAFTLCPAYPPVVDYFRGQIRRILGWGFEGLKLDGQHLNAVAPCYNPAHKHARPEESYEKLQDFWKALYDEAISINPNAVMEICPCGDSFAFHNIPGMNHTPASDPTSSWQIRLKGKTFKAMMGPSAPFAGDHVELSDRHDDFATHYGIGAILSTKFTWPNDPVGTTDPLPPGGIALHPQKEALWRKWIALYHANMLPKGEYLGGLYDIGFDKPESHAIRKDGRMHYAFYADLWSGAVVLRGLPPGRHRVTDSFTGKPLGTVSGPQARLPATFEHFLVLETTPLDGKTNA